ncbi:methyltransferase type 11 [Kribbella sp. ALI-6-A]|uniref:putative RNA methyltransferase n=1 Tax=Kribbella sp. ALI-6-A TaxID=1933817 RepID=UPI00097C8F18|nr:methyltransferase type 11 [Kribbella sp. ALI-6-A]ONI69491.1 methyltransferase type 11 [Kribbella sp. ALI-6-A]
MRADLVSVLRCPVCADGLELTDRTARCGQGHAYDLAKQGYLNLLPSASNGIEGDSAEMVEARSVFLAQGWYEPIREALIESLPPITSAAPLVVEVGAGTAYYLAGVLEAGNKQHAEGASSNVPSAIHTRPAAQLSTWRGIAVDVSRYAARRAAKVDAAIGSVVGDAWRELPVRDGVADVVLDVFAPRNAGEMARVLTPGGTLLVVTPNQAHLGELIDVLGMVSVDGEKERRLVESLAGFDRVGQRVVESTMRLDHGAIEQLVGMTPSARHVDKQARSERIGVLADPTDVTLSVTVSSWRTA